MINNRLKRNERSQTINYHLRLNHSTLNHKLTTVLLLAVVTGCTPLRPLHPGAARMRSGLGTNGVPEFVSEMKQPENPAQSATQNYERVTETELPLPAGSRVVEKSSGPDASGHAVNTEKMVVLAEPAIQKTRFVEKAGTVVGAAQKDAARELGAKLASLKGIVWVGVGLFVFGLASLTWPPLRLAVGSVTTSVAMIAGGVSLIVLPSLVAGNELLILGAVASCVAAWFLAHRHGHLRGLIDANHQRPARLRKAPSPARLKT